MRGSDLAEGTDAVDRAIEAVIGTIGRFSGKDATSYLASYRALMVMRDIPEERRLAGFPRLAMSASMRRCSRYGLRAGPRKILKVASSKNTGLMMRFGFLSETSWNG